LRAADTVTYIVVPMMALRAQMRFAETATIFGVLNIDAPELVKGANLRQTNTFAVVLAPY
jgi:hypothetical protein